MKTILSTDADNPETQVATPHPPAADLMSGVAGWWSSFSSKLLEVAAPLFTATRMLQNQLVASPPPPDERADRTAAIPHRLPVVPGIADLVPWARGGMGIVYRGRDVALNRPVAVKVIWPAAAGCERACERAKREALTLAQVSHPNVVTVYAAGEIDDSPYLVMEWIEGPSLHGRLASSRPSPRQAARIVRDLARAVAAVHEFGIIHRDIKPGSGRLGAVRA